MDHEFHDDRLLQDKQHLTRLLLGSVISSIALLCAVGILAARSTPPPYVVTVSPQGEVLGVARPIHRSDELGDGIVRYALKNFVRSAFTFHVNHEDNVEQIESGAYAFTDGHVGQVLTDFYLNPDTDSDIRKLENTAYQTVEFPHEPLRREPNVWQIDYKTIRHFYQDSAVKTANYTAIVRIKMGKPTIANELGIYIIDLDIEEGNQ